MIDPAPGVVPVAPVNDPAPSLPQRADTAQKRPAAETPREPASPPPNDPVLDVHLDSETMRLYTELRDPQTDRVLLRLPAAYKGEEGRPGGDTSFEA